jgi:hypothetical protein
MNRYLHVDVLTETTPRNPGDPIGDVVQVARGPASTSVVLADGLGHGIGARVAATLYAAQALELLHRDFSTREAFLTVAHDIHARRGSGGLYAALAMARVRPNGETTILTYDAPPAVFVGRQAASVLGGHTLENEPTLVREAHCFLEAGEGLLLVSDPQVSRRHCIIERSSDGRLYVRDVSRNGTRVAGRRIVPNVETEICPGQTLSIGSHSFEFDFRAADSGPVPQAGLRRTDAAPS